MVAVLDIVLKIYCGIVYMKKKILVDLSALKNVYRGLGQVALNYANYFHESYKSEDADYELTLLVPHKMIGKFGNEVKYLSSTNLFRKHIPLLRPRFDVWHSLHQLTRFVPFHRDTRYILTIHDLNYLYEREGASRARKHRQVQKKVNRADEIVCISKFTKTEIEEHLDLQGKPCRVIYNGVEELDPTLQKKPAMAIDKPFFFSVGVIKEKKNFHVLLDLMKLMPEKHLYIGGKEIQKYHKNGYARMIRARIEDEKIHNVTLLGSISHEEKIWFYEHCEAFLFPSLFEGFGLPVIEAMQFGKPVFSSRETSLQEIGGDFAFFWESFDPYDMKAVIDENLDRFYQDEILALEEKKYASSFSYKKHFEEYEKLYAAL